MNDKGQLILTDALGDLLGDIQRKGNKDVTYKTDREIYGTSEKWAYPKVDGLRMVGDCEDISLYKRKLLVEAGVPAAPMLLTICRDMNGMGHCVLSVTTVNRDYILCNHHETLVTPRIMMREGYKFLYRQSYGQPIDAPWAILE